MYIIFVCIIFSVIIADIFTYMKFKNNRFLKKRNIRFFLLKKIDNIPRIKIKLLIINLFFYKSTDK